MLLTLDLATNLGWTLGGPAETAFAFGAHRLPSTGEDIGEFAAAYDKWLRAIIFSNRGIPCSDWLVVFEAPVLPRETALMTARKLYGLTWHTELVCNEIGIECAEAHLQQIKKFITGSGRADKAAMVAAIRARGYDIGDDNNKADAIAIRLFTIHERYPEARAALGLDLGLLAGAHGHETDQDAQARQGSERPLRRARLDRPPTMRG